VHKDVSGYLEFEGLTIIPHPPNSLDLSPCDFWLFDLIKDNLIDFMHSLNRDEYKKTFDKWIERMQLYIEIIMAITLNIS
jgi:hypothetical protein